MAARRGTAFIVVGAVLLLVAGIFLVQGLTSLASDWAYEMTGIRDVQDRGFTGAGVRVAVIDTGVDPNHPSLDHLDIVAWRDYVNNRAQPYDDQGHGSHATGLLAGSGTDTLGRLQGFNMKGAAPEIQLIAIKAISAGGNGTSSDVADGVDFAVDRGADVICMSLGSRASNLPLFSDEITQSINRATGRGVLVVAAAGNTGQDPSRDDVERPADIQRVIAVGAVNEDKQVAPFSASGDADENYGSGGLFGLQTRSPPHQKPELVAPGVALLSAWQGGQYVRADGTSQAAPFVCGALALLLEAEPSLKSDNTGGMVDRVKRALADSAETIEGQRLPHDPRAGYGLLRADRLLGLF